MTARWLFKSDPEEYSFSDLLSEGRTRWDGISNNLALKNLRNTRRGDLHWSFTREASVPWWAPPKL